MPDVGLGQSSFCGELPYHQATSTNPDSIFFDRFGNSYDLFSSSQNSITNTNSLQIGLFTLEFSNEYSRNEINVCTAVFDELSDLLIQRELLNACGTPIANSPIVIHLVKTQVFSDPNTIATGTPFFYGSHTVCTRNIVHSNVYLKLNGISFQTNSFLPYDGEIMLSRNHLYFSGYPASCPSNLNDLYTIVMHEAMHVIAFHPLIQETFNISDYDLLFKNNTGEKLLTNVCSSYCYSSTFEGCSNDCDLTVGTQNNPVATIAHLENPSFVMYPFLSLGERKFLHPNEVQILCDMGYNTTTCTNSPFIVPSNFGGNFTRACGPYSGCCSNQYKYCMGEEPTIMFSDLLCFVHSSSPISIVDVIGHFNLTVFTDRVEIKNPESKTSGSIFVSYRVDLPNQPCKVIIRSFRIWFDQTCECEIDNVDICSNVLCYHDFDNLIPGNDLNFGFPFYFEDTPFGCNNTPDLYENLYPNNGNVVYTVENEAVVFKLFGAPFYGCQLELSLLAGNYFHRPTTLEIWGSEFPPCDINDKGINRTCGITTTCGDGTIFKSVCLGEYSLSETSALLTPLTIQINQNNIALPINYLFIINKSGDVAFDNISVHVNCPPPVSSFTSSSDCLSYSFSPDATQLGTTYMWSFGDGNTSTLSSPIHNYLNNGTFEVTLTAFSCGQSTSTTQNVEVNCIGPSSSCTNQSGCISIGTDISSQILLSDLINGTNPIIPNTPVYFGYEIKNQCFSLEGELVIDVWHATFNNTKWYCAPGSSIRIPNYGLFGSHWFINSTLQGCEKMWRGIIYEGLPSAPFLGSAGIALQGTTIKDAWHGVEMGNNTTITTYGSSFIDNYIGIFVAPNLGISQKIVTDIRNTNFIYDGTMLPMYTGQPEWSQRSHAGIRVHNLAQLNVTGGLFQNVQYGIRAINTSSNIQSAHFEDTDLFSSYGILIESAGPLTDITNQNLFTNLSNSIKLDGGRRAVIRISDNDFFNNRPNPNNIGYKGVWVLNHPASSLRINQQNTFNFIYGTAVEVTTALSYMQISDNDFTISGPDLTPIVLDGIKEASFVDNNDFFVGNGFRGKVMEIKNCQKIEFLSNIMHNGTATASSTGFDVRGSTQCLFRNNQVLFPGQGFLIQGGQASQNNYCCNTADQANPQSFTFYGANLKSNLKQNTLRKLQLRGDIGQQLSAGNIWEPSSIGWLVNGTVDKANFNRFTTTTASNARPTTITPAAIAPFWFDPTGTATTCATTPTCGLKNFFTGPLDPDLTLAGPYTPTVTPPSGDCFEFLNSIKDFLPLGTSTDDAELITYWNAAGLLENWQIEHGKVFWADCKDSLKGDPVVKEWIDVERVKDLVLISDGPLRSDGAAAMTDILNASAQISALPPLVIGSIPTTVFTAYEQMATATDAYQVVTANMGTSAATKAAALLPQVAALPASKSFLVDRKKVWTVELKIIATGVSSVTAAEWDEVRTIAQKCPLTSGQAVYEAQSLMKVIGKYYSSDIDIDCTTPKLRSIEITQEESEVSIHPNPSNGLFTINWPEDKMIDQIVISDISGRTVTQISVGNKRNVLIDLSSQHPGVYFYKATSGNSQVAQGKLIIIK
ncbi:MAG: T9SS type A sorting domain-containing protein [Saprospiraceae bacterium]|nr:T9SS type A sorting domain-containing protein [Saprospiraceae bacterium]MBP6567744.1 T9SS type A sorting domain-containing protein [Saprospiraceae bacterium]